jgi:hypothetical protein
VLLRSDLVRKRSEFYNRDNPFQADQEACYDVLREADFGFVHQVLTYTRRHEEAGFSYHARVGAQIPGQIDLLTRFGPLYLDQSELEQRLAARLLQYAWFFARWSPKLKKSEFREYHSEAIARLRDRIRAADVARGLARQAFRLARAVTQ